MPRVRCASSVRLDDSMGGSNFPEFLDIGGYFSIVRMPRRPWPRLGRLWLAGGFLCGAAPSRAQVVRGSARSRAMSEAVPATVLMLIDSANAAVARALADEHGDYALYAPSAGRYRIRALRIGFR